MRLALIARVALAILLAGALAAPADELPAPADPAGTAQPVAEGDAPAPPEPAVEPAPADLGAEPATDLDAGLTDEVAAGLAEAAKRPEMEAATCRAMRAQILAAVQLVLMENESGQAPECDVKSLVERGYLQSEPICPGRGVYTIRITANEAGGTRDVDVTCNVHP